MPESNTHSDESSQELRQLDEAIKRGSEVLPDVVAGSTGDQPPVAMITANPAMTPDPSPSSTEPAGSDVGGPGSSDQA